jgi:hypothetical protein
VSVRTLVDLMKIPGDVAVRQLLRAYPLARLSPVFGLLEPRHLTGLTEMAARHLVTHADVEVDVDAVTTALVQAVWPELQGDLARGAYSDGALERARPQVALLARQLAERLHDWWMAAAPTPTPLRVDPVLPWVLAAPVGRLLDDGSGQFTLIDLQRTIKVRTASVGAVDTAIGAVAAETSGVAVTGMTVIEQGTGRVGHSSIDEVKRGLRLLGAATADAHGGRFALARSTILRLSGDRASENGAS